MKKSSSKKGFSLIELIVVIAVIAAIAAVIVPSITNFNDEAKQTADKRNIQLWNQTYLEAKAAGATLSNTYLTGNNTATAISTNTMVGNTTVNFTAPTFKLAGNSTMAWDINSGFTTYNFVK